MTQIKAVVFDIGRVLVEWQPERFYDRVIGQARRENLFRDVDLYAMNARIDLGDPFRETVYDYAAAHPEYSADIRMWHDNWIELVTPDISGSVRLLRAIRAKGTAVFALSNIGVETFEIASKIYPFFDEFDQKYLSGDLREMKPYARIYELLEQGSSLVPSSLLFSDDMPENIQAAAARGWHTHLFDGSDGWAKALVHHGVLTSKEASL